jgi:hypothetical protein
MPYARTSERAEQRDLREKMRACGLSHRQIAFEFGRRYHMRPRAAWRHAHGWSLKQAAQQITAFATQAGVDPDGNTVAMTGPHLCEVEAWPGYGPKPTGRRPTPYLLSLLATVYDCAIADLLDLVDYEQMRPAERLVISKAAVPDVHHEQGASHRIQVGGRPEPTQPESQGVGGLAYPVLFRIAPLPAVTGRTGVEAIDAPPLVMEVADQPEGLDGLLPPAMTNAAADRGTMTTTAADIAMIRGVLEALTTHERQFGGADARAHAMQYLRSALWPRLRAARGNTAFSDLCAVGVEFSLRMASMQLDAGDAQASRELLGAGLPLAQETGNPVMVAWVLARFGELDLREMSVERAVTYTSAAAAMAGRSAPRARSFILAKHALALSMTGDRTAALRVLEKAHDSAGKAIGDGEPEWMRFYGFEHLRHDEARCLNNLGMGGQAIQAAEESMQARRLSRPRAFSLAVQAIGHVRSKDNAVDRACELGTELVSLTSHLASDRVKVELGRVLNVLASYRTSPAVRELTEAAQPVLAGPHG